jgi:uncharacterized protein YcbX
MSASIDSIWRYPVKSMAGEELRSAEVTSRGLLGDRAYALVEVDSNRVATVRRWASALLNYGVHFVEEPKDGSPAPPVRITLPDGSTVISTQPEAARRLSEIFSRELVVTASAGEDLRMEIPAGTLGGAYEHTTEVPLAGGAPAGTFFDYGSVHLLTTSTLDHLKTLYPQGRFDIRRFRPNILIRMQAEPFIENSWVERTLALGDEVKLRVSIPTPRCVNTTLPQADLPHDPGILRTIAQHNRRDLGEFGRLPCIGVYAEVVNSGRVRAGDSFRVLDDAV